MLVRVIRFLLGLILRAIFARLHPTNARVRTVINKVQRPSSVTLAQHHHLKAHPECAACGAGSGGQAHHIEPYNKFPDRAAAPDNFITLCETVGGPECHLHVGHGGNFKTYNPHVVESAAAYKAARSDAARQKIVDKAKADRLVDAP